MSRLSLHFRVRGGEAGIRTLGTGVSPYNGLANRRIRPLCHLSSPLICILEMLIHVRTARILVRENRNAAVRPPFSILHHEDSPGPERFCSGFVTQNFRCPTSLAGRRKYA